VERRGPAAYAAELIGTFALVLFITLVISIVNGLGAGFGPPEFLFIGLLHVLVLSMLIHTLGGVSGGHFNPAVTTAFVALRKLDPRDGVSYVVMQLAGGALGALVTKALLLNEGKAVDYGATTISAKFLEGHALPGLVAEAIGTFFLMWAIMGVAVNPQAAAGWAGLVIGGTLGFAVFVFAPLTGAGFNPARSFGPALVSGTWTDFWVYIVGPVVGAVLAATIYSALVLRPTAAGAEVGPSR